MDSTKNKEKIPTCQDCKGHKNNPSFCKTLNVHVGRKQEVCSYFKR